MWLSSSPGYAARLAGSVALAGLIVALAGGCTTMRLPETTGSVAATAAAPPSEADWRREVDAAGALYKANPRHPDAAIRYAVALRAIGQRSQAAAVLEQSAIHNPKNRAVLGAYGRALADAGNYTQALEVLERAHTPDQPDWRILSAQGAVLDQLGRHDEARRYYASALRLMPDEPSVLSNLGLSYALSKDLKQAEATLRRAAAGRATTKVRQILRWWWVCRAGSRKPKASPRPTCRPTRRPPTSPICGRCWHSPPNGRSRARRSAVPTSRPAAPDDPDGSPRLGVGPAVPAVSATP